MRNKLKNLLLIFIFGAIVSCRDNHEVNKKVQEVYTPFPYLLNAQKVKRYTLEENEPTWLSTAFYEFNYLGKLRDTVSLENGIKFPIYDLDSNSKLKDNQLKYYIDWRRRVQLKN